MALAELCEASLPAALAGRTSAGLPLSQMRHGEARAQGQPGRPHEQGQCSADTGVHAWPRESNPELITWARGAVGLPAEVPAHGFSLLGNLPSLSLQVPLLEQAPSAGAQLHGGPGSYLWGPSAAEEGPAERAELRAAPHHASDGEQQGAAASPAAGQRGPALQDGPCPSAERLCH